MRPIKLTMNAFGPYRDKIELDFTKFGSSSIFLVSGPTGSGKTMIFDGLTYALYNATSGEARETSMLKSQYATDTDLCYVELIFEVGDSNYRVYRLPQQTGPGQRVKTKEWNSDVEFYKDNQLISQGREANADIEALLGLTVNQFRQIVMLPQGEFRQLLLSKSNEKEAIFRNIFGTENIQIFQGYLREKRYDLRVAYKDFESKLDQLLSSITFEKETDIADAVKRKDTVQVIQLLSEIIQSFKNNLSLTRKEKVKYSVKEKEDESLLNLLNEREELLINKGQLEDLKPSILELENVLKLHTQALEVKTEQEKLSEFIQTYEEIEAELKDNHDRLVYTNSLIASLLLQEKESKQSIKQLENLRKEIQALEKERQKFAELELVEKEYVKHEKMLKNSNEEERKLASLEEKYALEIKEVEADLANIHNWREDLQIVTHQLTESNQKLTSSTQRKETLNKLIKLQSELTDLLKELERTSAKEKVSGAEYQSARKYYFENLAGVLAADLEEDTPCQVCGSKHHPQKAKSRLETISEEELSLLENQWSKDRDCYHTMEARVDSKAQAVKEHQETVDLTVTDYANDLKETEENMNELEKTIKALKEDKQRLEKNINEETTWRQDLTKLQAKYQETLLQLTQERNIKEFTSDKMTELSLKIEGLEQNIQFESTQEIERHIDDLLEKINRIEKEAEKIQSELIDAKTQEASLEATIKGLKNQLNVNQKNLEKQKAYVEEFLEKYAFKENFEDHLLEEHIKDEHKEEIKQYNENISFNTRQLEKVMGELEKREDKRSHQEITDDLERIKEDILKVDQQIEDYIAQLSQNESSLNSLKKNYEESEKVAKPLAIYEELTEIANGSSRTGYISFERYVLSIYFEEVLYAANKRFETMTNNQYQMVRRSDRTKGAGAEGLDIDVFDRYTGSKRSVNTLSGGETFKASLALALGLSDVIQSQQGGVRVDTLFIDEGFGTLDTDSLEIAIETLMDLQTTGRLIGIISHVEELKERVPTRIVVEKKQEGSQAYIEVL